MADVNEGSSNSLVEAPVAVLDDIVPLALYFVIIGDLPPLLLVPFVDELIIVTHLLIAFMDYHRVEVVLALILNLLVFQETLLNLLLPVSQLLDLCHLPGFPVVGELSEASDNVTLLAEESLG